MAINRAVMLAQLRSVIQDALERGDNEIAVKMLAEAEADAGLSGQTRLKREVSNMRQVFNADFSAKYYPQNEPAAPVAYPPAAPSAVEIKQALDQTAAECRKQARGIIARSRHYAPGHNRTFLLALADQITDLGTEIENTGALLLGLSEGKAE